MKTFRQTIPFLLFLLLPTLCLAALPSDQSAKKEAPVKKLAKKQPLNILFITLDDMNWDSLGCTGCKIPGISPHMDKLASEGIRFEHAHVTSAVCQPARQVWLTGRYPHNNGSRGFWPIKQKEITLTEHLRKAGYRNGILTKIGHLKPIERFAWDVQIVGGSLGNGRSAKKYYEQTKQFLADTKKTGKPFFFMANSQDPHRPFAVEGQEKKRKGMPGVTKRYYAKDITVPGFLPDLPDVRKEIAEYYTSVHRADEIVGAVLKALKESGYEKNTLVILMSDHGISAPFAKTNCYFQSTRIPLIVRWPGSTKAGVVDKHHMVSGIDLTPTILDAAGVKPLKHVDGRSYVPLLLGKKQKDRNHVYTNFHQTAMRKDYEMRSFVTRKFGYIYNAWSDGKKVFRNEGQAGRIWRAMKEAAKTDPKIAARVKMYSYRVKEELYDYENDPCALNNLINDPKYKATAEKLRRQTLKKMQDVKDPLLKTFQKEIPVVIDMKATEK